MQEVSFKNDLTEEKKEVRGGEDQGLALLARIHKAQSNLLQVLSYIGHHSEKYVS